MTENKTLVLVPSFNHGKFIKDRVESIIAQDYDRFDLLIIDDASTDETSAYLGGLEAENLTIVVRSHNSGSPFAAWADAAKFGNYDYIWIAESDDVSDPKFLARAIAALDSDPNLSLYYTHSWCIDRFGDKIGHTLPYLSQYFPTMDWHRPFKLEGSVFNNKLQIFGNALPNMSSAVLRMSSFRSALDPKLLRYKLAADWFFVGRVAATGGVCFEPWEGNQFRRHDRTARAETSIEQRCFEYFVAAVVIGGLKGVKVENFNQAMMNCATMFVHERASPYRLVRVALRTDPLMAVRVAMHILGRVLARPGLILGGLRLVYARMKR